MLVQRPRPATLPMGKPAHDVSERKAVPSSSASLATATPSSASRVSSKAVNHFTRWRPSFHLIAPKNWMNDPCGPCYDERTGLYHVLYQYNPKGSSWGNMSWMHATSTDLVHWKHVADEPSLAPGVPHDREGVFSGAMVPHGPKGEAGMLTIFYTAVSALPIHFTKPYKWGCEALAMATSIDGGKSWQRDAESSVLVPGPPDEFMGEVISWRDPFISPWPAMDVHLGLPADRYVYGVVSGGLRGKTPTAFLYRIDRHDMTKWTYVSTIADVGLNYSLGVASGDMGRNWEVCNFFNLHEEAKDDATFLLMNVEGVGADGKSRHPMWSRADLAAAGTSGQQVALQPRKSGLVDYGCLYAATTFLHAPTQRRLLWGWITEDDLAESRYEQQGWSGCISLPREVVRLTYHGVTASTAAHALVQPSFDVQANDNNVKNGLTMSTVGFRPAQETLSLRDGAKHLVVRRPTSARQTLAPLPSRKYELLVEIAVDQAGVRCAEEEVGVLLYHNASKTNGVKVVYSNEAVHVVRSLSTRDTDVNTSTITAPLPLLRFVDGRIERVQMRIFVDNSVVEVFVNDRVVITTRVYCDDESANMVSLYSSRSAKAGPTTRFDAETLSRQYNSSSSDIGVAANSRIEHVEVWHGLQSAMLGGGTLPDELTNSHDSDQAHL